MGDDLTEADMDEGRIAQVRQAVTELMAERRLTMPQVAREAAIGQSTLAAFLADKYKGNCAGQALTLQRWLTARSTGAAVQRDQMRGPPFVRTRTSDAFAALLEHSQFAPDFAVIVGAPGIGKTTVAEAYARNGHNVWLITCQPTGGTPNILVNDVALALELIGNASIWSSAVLNRLIIKRLKGLQSLLIVDEAQHMSSQALDQLRTYHDLTGCGVTLIGNHSIFRRLEGGSRAADYAQLFSRVGMRLDRRKPHADDIEQLLDGWGIEDAAVRRVARAVARKPGALRAMTKVLRQAHLRAREGDGLVTEQHILAAARQLGDEKPLEMDP